MLGPVGDGDVSSISTDSDVFGYTGSGSGDPRIRSIGRIRRPLGHRFCCRPRRSCLCPGKWVGHLCWFRRRHEDGHYPADGRGQGLSVLSRPLRSDDGISSEARSADWPGGSGARAVRSSPLVEGKRGICRPGPIADVPIAGHNRSVAVGDATSALSSTTCAPAFSAGPSTRFTSLISTLGRWRYTRRDSIVCCSCRPGRPGRSPTVGCPRANIVWP